MLAELSMHLDSMVVNEGTHLCRQGERGDCLYLVVSGTFGIFVAPPGGGPEVRVNTIRGGEYCGEMALLTGETRSATIKAESDAQVLRLDRESFFGVLRRQPYIAGVIIADLSRKLRALSEAMAQLQRSSADAVDRSLNQLPPERRLRLLQSGVLEAPTPQALQAMFKDDARLVAEDLDRLRAGSGHTLAALLLELRERLQREYKPEYVRELAQMTAWWLAEAGCWADALAVMARYRDREAFLGILGQALRAETPIPAETAARWVGQVTLEEAARDPELALARARLLEQRRDLDGALQVLQRALTLARAAGYLGDLKRLGDELARIAANQGRPQTGPR